MNTLLIIIGIIFFFSTLGVIYRILSLLHIAKSVTGGKTTISNKINAFLFPVFFITGMVTIVIYSYSANDFLLPEAVSIHGKKTDFLFWISMVIIGIVFFITHILLFFFPYIYRFKRERKAHFYPDNNKLEIIWTAIPAITMIVLVFLGWRTWHDMMYNRYEDAITIEIMGKQFNWQVRYPGKDGKLGKYDFRKINAINSMGIDFTDASSLDDFLPHEIHLPKGKPIKLNIRSRDVIHSVFMPHFRLKMDAVPGMQTHFWFTPTKTTAEIREELSKDIVWKNIDPNTEEPKWKNFNYELACTEVCGSGHFAMRMLIIVEEPEEFDKWYDDQQSWANKNADYITSILETENVQAESSGFLSR